LQFRFERFQRLAAPFPILSIPSRLEPEAPGGIRFRGTNTIKLCEDILKNNIMSKPDRSRNCRSSPLANPKSR